MSDFFNPPFFGAPTMTDGQLLAGIAVSTRYRQTECRYSTLGKDQQGYTAAAFDLTQVPWGARVTSDYYEPGASNAQPEDTTRAEKAVTDAQAALDQTLALIAGGADVLAGARAAQLAAQGDNDAAAALAQSKLAYLAAVSRRSEAQPPTATPEEEAAARAAYLAAAQAAAPLADALAQANAALAAARSKTLDSLSGQVQTNLSVLADAQTVLALLELGNRFIPVGGQPGDPPVVGYSTGLGIVAQENSFSLPDFTLDEYRCQIAPLYSGSSVAVQYQHAVRVRPDAFQAAVNQGRTSLTFCWNEVTSSRPTKSVFAPPFPVTPPGHQCPGYHYAVVDDVEPVITYAGKSEAFDVGTAAVQPDGYYLLYGDVHDIPAPDPGSQSAAPARVVTIRLQGPVQVGSAPAIHSIEVRSAQAARTGWSEHLTPGTQAQPNRYATLTAGNGPGTPPGVEYSGYLTLPPTLVGGADPPENDSPGFSADVGYGGDLLPSSLVPVTEGATILDEATRLLAAPAGLVLTLSEPQTPGQVAESVAGAIADYPATDGGNQSDPGEVVNFASADGDQVVGGRARFKLRYGGNYGGDTHLPPRPYTQTFRWEFHVRDLATGQVAVVPQSRNVRFPIVTTSEATDPNPPHATTLVTSYSYFQDDDDWQDYPTAAGKSVRLVLRPGTYNLPGWYGFEPLGGAGGLSLGASDPSAAPLGTPH